MCEMKSRFRHFMRINCFTVPSGLMVKKTALRIAENDASACFTDDMFAMVCYTQIPRHLHTFK